MVMVFLVDDLYRFNIDVNFKESWFNIEHVVGSKRNTNHESSAYLWHQILCHI